MIIPTIKNPLDPNDYLVFEENGFEFLDIGLFKKLVPVRKVIGFLTDEFVRDNAKLGIKIGFSDGQFYGDLKFSANQIII